MVLTTKTQTAQATNGTPPASGAVPSVRLGADNESVLQSLGLLAELAGSWRGEGFNLIARPDFHDSANLYLQLTRTQETLSVVPIGSPIPNRAFGQDDIELAGLHYLQQINDADTGGALHLEPGLWVTQPPTDYPPENPPAGAQIVARMGSIPHGNALLAAGTAEQFTGNPILAGPGVTYNGSAFPSFNSTPFPSASLSINAAGSSEKATAAANGKPPFDQYDLTVPASLANPRTPFGTNPPDPPLPASVLGVSMQDLVNDPIRLLQAIVQDQLHQGCAFQGVTLNIATQSSVSFLDQPNAGNAGASIAVNVAEAGGGIENIPFLLGTPAQGANAQTALVYSTFWIEKVTGPNRAPFMQLQYAQMVVLNFPIFSVLHPGGTTTPSVVSLGWPHITVGTLKKTFG